MRWNVICSSRSVKVDVFGECINRQSLKMNLIVYFLALSNMSQTIEATLPEDSIIRKLIEAQTQPIQIADEKQSEDIKEVEKTLTDEEYEDLMKKFMEHVHKQQLENTPKKKLERKIKMLEEQRKPVLFRDLKKGFLN